MKIHEYQAKEILARYGVPTPNGRVAETAGEAVKAAAELTLPIAIKAQVHVGGRGKAGGIKLARTTDEVGSLASAILGMNIKGSVVRKVLVESGVDIRQEIYLGLIVDRASKHIVLMASAAGGVEIEEVAAQTPEKILKVSLKRHLGMPAYVARQTAAFLGLPPAAGRPFAAIAQGLYRAFIECDCSLAEINPLVVTGDGGLIACDAKMNFDDNALYRHPEIAALRDEGEEEPLETDARRHRVSYVKLDGRIGCLVNGAGLAMATMDVVKHFGGAPANFLDIGGGAKPEQVVEALRIITADPNVNTILFNIFGGIVRCDRVAEGILIAQQKLNLKLPIVIRLSGTNEELARDMLKDAGLIAMPTMSEACKKAVEISQR
ncbi:MAG: ADP-forming succinate--CoA ligase subunit beta [Candidatus Sumerlaeia bacterium]|nr:ADP-forming succinate--CoA ligase subunit beta [Candidatus Sumerlaeia bacterium]